MYLGKFSFFVSKWIVSSLALILIVGVTKLEIKLSADH